VSEAYQRARPGCVRTVRWPVRWPPGSP